jgi:hypothetical protein
MFAIKLNKPNPPIASMLHEKTTTKKKKHNIRHPRNLAPP